MLCSLSVFDLCETTNAIISIIFSGSQFSLVLTRPTNRERLKTFGHELNYLIFLGILSILPT
jgi:uncharacterized membrane protein